MVRAPVSEISGLSRNARCPADASGKRRVRRQRIEEAMGVHSACACASESMVKEHGFPSVFLNRLADPLSDNGIRVIVAYLHEAFALTKEWTDHATLARKNPLGIPRDLRAGKALCYRMFRVALDADDGTIRDAYEKSARIRAVERADRPDLFFAHSSAPLFTRRSAVGILRAAHHYPTGGQE
jgi:hypothetical protein